MRDYSGKVVVLTGAASGIGRALAIGLASEGAHLALCDVDAEGLRVTAGACGRSPHVTTSVVDVADWAAVQAFAQAVERDHGGVDMLINNAGISCVATIEQTTHDDFARVLGVNLWGVIHGIQAFLPLLRQRPEGQIVNVASLNSFVPFPTSGPYNVSKFGVDALTQTLMAELSGTAITVSCVYPGGVKTNIARNARYVTDSDAAGFEHRARISSEQAARRIIRGVKRGRQRIIVGADARILAFAGRLAPQSTLRLVTWGWRRIERSR
ncbi:MAG: SDR family oxidoreductase [Micromonosporaceae bacterium]|nr:SDR family oxidoreductase [Micromonosporaceae bacterium]